MLAGLAELLRSPVAHQQQPLRGGVSSDQTNIERNCSLSTLWSHKDILSAWLSSPALSARTICRTAGKEELATRLVVSFHYHRRLNE